MKLYVANVGVNTSHSSGKAGLKSPVFPDSTFEFVPIEEDDCFSRAEGIPTYHDLPSWTGRIRCLAELLPERVRRYRAHADPDFEKFTYGDIDTPRAANLNLIKPGDQLWFLARLWNHHGTRWTGDHDFYFIGFIEVERNLSFAKGTRPADISAKDRKRIENNAHYRRLMAGDREWFRVLCGKPRRSCRFNRALRVTADVAGLLFGGLYDASKDMYIGPRGIPVKNKNGRPRSFRHFGSITRTIQCFLDSSVPKERDCVEVLAKMARKCGCHSSPDKRIGRHTDDSA